MGSKLQGVFRDSAGNAVASPVVTVYEAGGSTPAATFSDNALSAALANPFTGDANGQWECFVAPGQYRITGPGGYDEDYVRAAPLPMAVNVLDYGADKTGAADSTAAFAAAHTALPATGGIIFVPPGTYKIAAQFPVSKPNVTLRGAGREATVITTPSATNNLIQVLNGADGFLIDSLHITASVTRTSGAFVRWNNVSRCAARNLYLTGYYIGIHFASTVTCDVSGVILRDGVPATTAVDGAGILMDTAANTSNTLHNVVMDAPSGQPSFGICLKYAQGLRMSNCDIIRHGIDLALIPGTGQTVGSLFASNCYFDTATNGVLVNPTGTGIVQRSKFTNCWMSSHSGSGVVLNNSGTGKVSGLTFTACDVLLNGEDGIDVVSAAVTDVQVVGGRYAQNTAAGLAFVAASQLFEVIGAEIGPTAALTGNNVGIALGSGCNNYVISGCRLSGNTTAAITGHTQSPTAMVVGCIGTAIGSPRPFASTLASSSAAIANTVSETAFSKTIAIPANVFAAGARLRVRAAGTYSTTGTPTMNLRVKIGTDPILQGTITTSSGAANLGWIAEAEATVRTAGASGVMVRSGALSLMGGGVIGGALLRGTFALNTTAQQTISVTVVWGAADPANTITMESLSVEVIPAHTVTA